MISSAMCCFGEKVGFFLFDVVLLVCLDFISRVDC